MYFKYYYILTFVTFTCTAGFEEDIWQDASPLLQSWRYSRNPGRHPEDTGVRFGHQNPILVAPTLPSRQFPNPNYPPFQSYPVPTTPRFGDYNRRPTGSPTYYPPPPPTSNRPVYEPTPDRGGYPNFIPRPTPTPTRPYERFSTTPRITFPTYQPAQPQRQCPTGQRRNRATGQCHRLGERGGICNENMAFYEDPSNDEYGWCDCIQNFNRPLFYHRETDKCYFVFQQAYCRPGQWLVLLPNRELPSCQRNRCTDWTELQVRADWNWTSNGYELDKDGTVALLEERQCVLLGWPCTREGNKDIGKLLVERRPAGEPYPDIIVKFEGTNLVCSRDDDSEFDVRFGNENFSPACKTNLFNKWRQAGNCK